MTDNYDVIVIGSGPGGEGAAMKAAKEGKRVAVVGSGPAGLAAGWPVPTATDKSHRITGNEISGLSISLPVHVADPVQRAKLVALATRIAKEDHEIMGPELYGRMMAYLPTAFAPAAFRWLGRHDVPNKLMNVAVSSVVGPRQRGHFGGATVSEIYSTGVLSPGAPVNITVWSYVDQLGIAVLTDDQTFHEAHEATDALTKAFSELRSAADISAQAANTASSAE